MPRVSPGWMLLVPWSMAHAEPAVSTSIQAGLIVPDPGEPTGAVYTLRPTVGAWFTHAVGLEASLDSSWMPEQEAYPRRRLLMPSLRLAFEPMPARHPVKIRPIVRVGGGVRLWSLDGDPDRVDGLFTAGLGLAFPVAGALRIRTDLDALITAGAEEAAWASPAVGMSWTVGVEIKLGTWKDRDGDLVPDRFDACPDVPEDLDGFEDDDGCPELDNDGDGIRDALDACPNEPEDFDGFEDWDGCPDPDNDGDGILDEDDACPNEPGPPPDGCPPEGWDPEVEATDTESVREDEEGA